LNRPLFASRRTPIDHNFGTCDRTCAKLLIYPSVLRHSDVTQLLGIEPTKGRNKGDEVPTARGTIRVAKVTSWLMSSEYDVSSKDVRAHLDWLLDRLANAHDALRDLQQHHEVRMSVNCVWWSRGGHGGPTLWPEQMRQLAELNLECSFDVQFYPDDEGEGRK
jgi:hypothetical protein